MYYIYEYIYIYVLILLQVISMFRNPNSLLRSIIDKQYCLFIFILHRIAETHNFLLMCGDCGDYSGN